VKHEDQGSGLLAEEEALAEEMIQDVLDLPSFLTAKNT